MTFARGDRSGIAIVLLALLTLHASPARATDTVAPATEGRQKALARAKYEEGVEAFRNQRYVDAVRFFLEADAIAPSIALSFNVALAYEKLGDEASALRWYRNYLRLDPNASNAAEVRARIQTLTQALAGKGIQQLTVLSTPPGATVAVDGRAVGVTPLTIERPPGDHEVWLTAPGYADTRRVFHLTATTPVDLSFTLAPRGPELAQQRDKPSGAPSQPEPPRRFGIWPYVTLGAGAAALTSAAIFEALRASAEDDARHENEQLAFERAVNRMEANQTAARVLLGVGGVLVVGGTALLVFNTPLTPETRTAVFPLPGGAAVSVSRDF